MQLHGSPTPKRATLWSCMPQVADLNLGVLTLEEKRKRTTTQTVRKYYDKRGKARFVGTSELSRSQKLGPHYFNLNEMGFQKHPLHMFMQLRIVSQVLFQDQISYCECLQCTDSNIMIHATILPSAQGLSRAVREESASSLREPHCFHWSWPKRSPLQTPV